MEQVLSAVNDIRAQIELIEAEISEIETKGTFSYGRSKNIRAAALEIAKSAKTLRVSTLDAFKAAKAK